MIPKRERQAFATEFWFTLTRDVVQRFCSVIVSRGQQQIAIHLIVTLQRGCLLRPDQSPELAATFEYPSCFQLIACDLSQINLVAVGNYRQEDLVSDRYGTFCYGKE